MAKNMYQKRKERKESIKEIDNKTNINWYPGHMAKTKREINDTISQIDIVVELLDARIPFSSHIPDINDLINNKILILVFNKYDLCDKTETNKWIKYYEDKGFVVVTCNSKESNDFKNVISTLKSETLHINEKRKKKGLLPKKIKALILGVPNVGKSTLINRITGKKVADVGNKPGVTRNLNTFKINNEVDLVDTPGILWPKIQNEKIAYNLATMSIIKEEIIPIEEIGIYILEILNKYYKDILKNEFNIESFDRDNITELFEIISRYKNIPIKGEVDYEKVSLLILNLIKQEKIKGITFDRID